MHLVDVYLAKIVLDKNKWIAIGLATAEVVLLDPHLELLGKFKDLMECKCEYLKAVMTALRSSGERVKRERQSVIIPFCLSSILLLDICLIKNTVNPRKECTANVISLFYIFIDAHVSSRKGYIDENHMGCSTSARVFNKRDGKHRYNCSALCEVIYYALCDQICWYWQL